MRPLLAIIGCLSLVGCAEPAEWVEPIEETCLYQGVFEADSPMEHVELVTLTPNFSTSRQTLTRTRGTTKWSFSLDRSTAQFYLINTDGRYQVDARNALSAEVNGQEWSYLPKQACGQPTLRFVGREVRSERTFIVVQLIRQDMNAPLNPDSVEVNSGQQTLSVETIDDQILVDITGLAAGKHFIRVTAQDQSGAQTAAFEHPIWIEGTPFDWRSSVMYQVVTDRFAGFSRTASSDWHIGKRRGGSWLGLQQKIEAGFFDQFGVNAIWVSPINLNPEGMWVGVEGGPPRYEGYHGYWRVSNTEIEPAFGTAEQLKSMVRSAHSRGIRVILDVVLNHQHVDFQDAERSEVRGNELCICGTPTCPWWRDIQRCWFTPYLPDIDYAKFDNIQLELDRIVALVKTYDFDGLRIDAVPMMPRFVTRHLKHRMRAEFEGLGTPFLLIGETFTAPDGYEHIRYYLGKHGLDGQFDFPLMWALRSAFADDSIPLRTLVERWYESERAWAGSDSTMGLMIGNHDVPRFINIAAGFPWSDPWHHPPTQPTVPAPYERTLLAQSFVLGMPGISTLYYGDELGLMGGPDPDNRRPYPWFESITEPQRDLKAKLGIMGKVRRCLGNQLDADVQFPLISDGQLAFARLQDNSPRLIVVINRRPTEVEVNIPLDLWTRAQTDQWVDQLSRKTFLTVNEHLKVQIGANETRWLLPVTDICEGSGTQR